MKSGRWPRALSLTAPSRPERDPECEMDTFTGLTQNCPGKAERRRQYTQYGKARQRRWGGFA